MLAELVLLSSMTWQVTSYRSVPEQTDDTPFHTSIGLHVKEGFCAVSQDQLGKLVHYGDILYVEVPAKPELSRYCMVADTMNKRIKRGIDFWVATKAEEHRVNVRVGRVYKLNTYKSQRATNKYLTVEQQYLSVLRSTKSVKNTNH